jgi:hypothetical protein
MAAIKLLRQATNRKSPNMTQNISVKNAYEWPRASALNISETKTYALPRASTVQ